MFIIETSTAKAAKKTSIVMEILFVLTASFGVFLTMHIYVKPSSAAPRGFRVFGFPRIRPSTSAHR
jgi:hypothetical protein